MSVTADKVVVELEARLAKYNSEIARAEANFGKSMASIQSRAERAEAVVGRAMGGIGAAIAGVSAIALARTFLQIADEAKKLDAQLKLATAGFGSFNRAQEDVRRIADITRSGLSETASLYGNFARGAKELGANQEAAARATETFSKTLKISGASAAEAGSATLQFGQALAAGALRGDELNSILEASPRLARLLAESMGKPIGEIKKLGEEGQLTSDKLLRALTDQKFTAGIDAEFRELPVTFEDAMTQVSNAAIITFGAFDRGGQFSKAIADFVTDGSNGFKSLEDAAEAFGRKLSEEIAGVISVAELLKDAIDGIGNAMGEIIDDKEQFARSMEFIQKYSTPLGIITEGIRQAGAPGREEQRRKLNKAAVDRAIEEAIAYNPPSTSKPRPSAISKKTPKRTRTGRKPVDYTEQELARLNEEELRARLDLATDVQERADLARQLLVIERDDVVRRLKARKALTPDAQAAIDRIYGKDAQVDKDGNIIAHGRPGLLTQRINRDAERQREQQASALLSLQQQALSDEADLLDSRKAQLAAQRRILELMEREEKNRLESEIATGQIAAADADTARAALARSQSARREGVNRDAEGPLARYRRDLNNPDRAGDEVEAAVIDELESVRDGISNAVQKTLGVKNPILAALLNAFIEQQLIKPFVDGLANASGGGGGLLGGLISGIGSIFGGFRANGGPVQAGKSYIVGERGPELIRMGGNGVVVPNKALTGRGAAGTTVISAPQFNLRGAVITPQLYADMERISRASAEKAAAQMGQRVIKNVPARMAQFQTDGT